MVQTNLIGKTILGYTVGEKLGSGAFGTVYKVIKTNVSGQYIRALKHITIPTEKQYNSVLNSMGGDVSKADSYFAQMLNSIVSEIQILNSLSERGTQHIVRYYENDIIATASPKRYDIFILMEYLTPLEDYIQSHNFLVRDVVKLGLDVLDGLQSCYDNGVIHRDIKDDNIFVSNKGEYKIGDFGVSKILKDSSKAESLKGTPNFLAPEVYLGKEGYTKSVDLYSLGIVLYRLLNYSRNPFVPSFPAQYFSQDEDKAFEERMSGKIPPLPSLGGEEIGRVIIRAISGSNERFQIAGEFINALESAISKTSDSVLDESVKFNTASSPHSQSTVHQKQYASTIGEVLYESTIMEHSNDERNSSINKHLFESIGEAPNLDVPKVTPAAPAVQKDETDHKTKASGKQTVNSVRVVDVVPPVINEPDKTAAVDKKEIGKVVFPVPVIIFLIGVIAFFIVVPNIYGNTVSFIDWMISDPQNIIDTLRDSNVVLPKVYGIIGIKFFWWVWLACLIASLFFVGRQLHAKPEPNAANAILTKREPYLMMQDVYDALKSLKARTNDKRLDAVLYAAKRVEEKLSVESDFGYGKDIVINCENNIAKQLQFLLDIIPVADNGNIEENMKAINTAISNINSLLRKRTELKRR